MLCSLPATQKADFAKINRAIGSTGVKMVPASEISLILGCPNVTPFVPNGSFALLVDEQALEGEFLYLGGGTPGADIEIAVADFIQGLHPVIGDFAK